MFPAARFDDGLLDLCVFPCRSRLELLRHACFTVYGKHVGRNGVIYAQCRRIMISSEEQVPIEIDGEPGGTLPAEVTVLPGAAHFLGVQKPNVQKRPKKSRL